MPSTAARASDDGVRVEFEHGAAVEAEEILVAVGRVPRTAELGLDSAGVEAGEHGFLETDERMLPWREIARRHGIHSSLAIPICPPNRTPTTILTIYSELPGGYASPEQIAYAVDNATRVFLAGYGAKRG